MIAAQRKKGMNSARETAGEAESICSTPLRSSLLSPNHISASDREQERQKETEREREGERTGS